MITPAIGQLGLDYTLLVFAVRGLVEMITEFGWLEVIKTIGALIALPTGAFVLVDRLAASSSPIWGPVCRPGLRKAEHDQ